MIKTDDVNSYFEKGILDEIYLDSEIINIPKTNVMAFNIGICY